MKFGYVTLLITLSLNTFNHNAVSMEQPEEASQEIGFVHLPCEMKEKIFDYLPVKDLSAVSQTCTKLNAAVEDDRYWKQRGIREYGEKFVERGNKIGNDKTWKDIYAHFPHRHHLDHVEKKINNKNFCHEAMVIPLAYLSTLNSLETYRKNHSLEVRYLKPKNTYLATVSGQSSSRKESSQLIQKFREKTKKNNAPNMK